MRKWDCICLICGGQTTNHHNYCNEHYPKENALLKQIRDLTLEIREYQRKEIKYKLTIQQLHKREKELCNRLRKRGVELSDDCCD